MIRQRIAPPVNTTVTHRRWWGGRIKDRWMQSNAAWLVSGVLFTLVLGGWIWTVLTPPGAPLPGTVTANGATSAAPTLLAPSSDVMPSPVVTCAPQAPVEVPPEQLVMAAYITTWYPVGTMAAPGSPTGGPVQARRCFTRTPEGALYAAVTRFAEEATATGVVQDAAEHGVTNLRATGYQWVSFTPDRAVLVLRIAGTGQLETRQAAQVVDITWSGNDWEPVPNTSTAAKSAALDPKRVFTSWGSN